MFRPIGRAACAAAMGVHFQFSFPVPGIAFVKRTVDPEQSTALPTGTGPAIRAVQVQAAR